METYYEKQARELHDAISSHDIDKALSFYTDDIQFEQVWEGGVTTHGKDEIMGVFNYIFAAFPDYRAEMTSSFVSADRMCIEWVMTGTHKGEFNGIPGTGKGISLRACTAAELRDGKYSRISLYADLSTLLRQLGALPESSK